MIYFMTPDFANISGGITVIYEVADALRPAGVSTTVWHGRSGFRAPGMESQPTDRKEALTLEPGDILVVPETNAPAWQAATKGVPKVVLAQNHFYSLAASTAQDVVAYVATSREIARFLPYLIPSASIFHLPLPIDLDTFTPATKKQVVAWMPRKRGAELELVVAALKARANLAGWQFEPLDGLSRQQVADYLGQTKLFLLGNEREGLGLPGLEAMASGCITIGFLGGGGREYSDYPLCYPIDDGDLAGFVNTVERLAATADEEVARQTEVTRSRIATDHGGAQFRHEVRSIFLELAQSGAAIETRTVVEHMETPALRHSRSLRGTAEKALGRLRR